MLRCALLRDGGATVHLRPICTVHTCSIASLGFKKNDQEWTKRYYELRDKMDVAEASRCLRSRLEEVK